MSAAADVHRVGGIVRVVIVVFLQTSNTMCAIIVRTCKGWPQRKFSPKELDQTTASDAFTLTLLRRTRTRHSPLSPLNTAAATAAQLPRGKKRRVQKNRTIPSRMRGGRSLTQRGGDEDEDEDEDNDVDV
jgi:hypothetical protein